MKTLPGIREAIEEERWDEAQEHVGLVAQRLEALAARLEEATKLLDAG